MAAERNVLCVVWLWNEALTSAVILNRVTPLKLHTTEQLCSSTTFRTASVLASGEHTMIFIAMALNTDFGCDETCCRGMDTRLDHTVGLRGSLGVYLVQTLAPLVWRSPMVL